MTKRQISHAIKKIFNDTLLHAGARKFGDAVPGEKHILINDFGGSPYIENLLFQGVKGETMLHALDAVGVIVGLGSACSAKKAGNRVLEEIGMDKDDIISSVRISFNAYMTDEEVHAAAEIISKVYEDILQRVS